MTMNQAKEHVSCPKVLNAHLKTFSVDNLGISAGMSGMANKTCVILSLDTLFVKTHCGENNVKKDCLIGELIEFLFQS